MSNLRKHLRLTKEPLGSPGTFEQYLHYCKSIHGSAALKHEYPCITCSGYGKVRKEEERDAYEGYKLANWYKCQTCNGSGESTHEVWLNFYQKAKEAYEVKLNAAQEAQREELELLTWLESNLTLEQQKTLLRIF